MQSGSVILREALNFWLARQMGLHSPRPPHRGGRAKRSRSKSLGGARPVKAGISTQLNGYTIYRKDRGSRGGGVMLAIENCLSGCELQSPPNLELITVSIYLKTIITCCMVYIPPNATTEYHAELVSYLANITSSPTPVFIFGDFNMPDVNWSTLNGSLATSNRFCDMDHYLITFKTSFLTPILYS